MGVMHTSVNGCQRTCCVLAMMMYPTWMGKVQSENPEGQTFKGKKVFQAVKFVYFDRELC